MKEIDKDAAINKALYAKELEENTLLSILTSAGFVVANKSVPIPDPIIAATTCIHIRSGICLAQRFKEEAERLDIGTHLSICRTRYRGVSKKVLSDGTVIAPGQMGGRLDLVRNIPQLGEEDNLVAATRSLYDEALFDLKILAYECMHNEFLEEISFFYGYSHLVRSSARKLGFDVFDIRNPLKQAFHTHLSKQVVEKRNKENKTWQAFKGNFKPAKEAFISRDKLVSLYS